MPISIQSSRLAPGPARRWRSAPPQIDSTCPPNTSGRPAGTAFGSPSTATRTPSGTCPTYATAWAPRSAQRGRLTPGDVINTWPPDQPMEFLRKRPDGAKPPRDRPWPAPGGQPRLPQPLPGGPGGRGDLRSPHGATVRFAAPSHGLRSDRDVITPPRTLFAVFFLIAIGFSQESPPDPLNPGATARPTMSGRVVCRSQRRCVRGCVPADVPAEVPPAFAPGSSLVRARSRLPLPPRRATR
jgi:hypothetical protein